MKSLNDLRISCSLMWTENDASTDNKKSASSHQDILKNLIELQVTDCEEICRNFLMNSNGLAGVYLINNDVHYFNIVFIQLKD